MRELRRPALVAGVGLLVLAVLAGAANVGAVQRLVTAGDPTRTANDITASAGVFRLGIAALVVAAVLDVVVAWALRSFFEPVDAGLATLAAWLRLGYAAIFIVAISQLAGVLRVLSDATSVSTLTLDQRRAEALLKIQTYQDIWQLGLALFGLHLVLLGYLAYRSGYVPRTLGVLLAVAGGGYLVDTFAGLLVADYGFSVSAFTFIGEALLMLWLLVRGREVTVGVHGHAPEGT
jgi:ABC-type multidrug transport system fused ATPase/permease subunit